MTPEEEGGIRRTKSFVKQPLLNEFDRVRGWHA